MAGYTRQSSGLIISGSTILASHSNNEYNAIESSMNATTGHYHDGTTGGGAPVSLTGSVTGVLPVANGGTAGATAGAARTALGLVIGTDIQAYDAGLLSLAGLTTAADKMVYTTASDTYAVTALTAFARTILDDADEATVRATLNLEPGTDVQTQDAHLTDLAALSAVSAADNFMVSTGSGAWGYENAATVRTTLGLVIGTNVQAEDPHLTDLAALSAVGAADNFMVSTAAGAWAYENASTVRTTLGLVIGTNVQAEDPHLTDLAALSTVTGANQFMVSTGVGTWGYEAPSAVKDSLSLNIGTDIQAQSAHLDDLDALGAVSGADQFMVSTAAGAWGYESAATVRTTLGLVIGTDVLAAGTGKILQSLFGNVAAASGTTSIPADDTSPLVSEGTEIFTQDITPAATGNDIEVSFSLAADHSTGAAPITVAVFSDSVCIGVTLHAADSAGILHSLSFQTVDSPSTTSATTYSVRVGTASGTWYVNQPEVALYNGNLAKNGYTIKEISA